MTSIRRTLSLAPAVAERQEREAKRRNTSFSALIAELVRQPERLLYPGLIVDDEDLAERVEKVLARIER